MADYMRVGPDGCPRLDYSTLTRDQAAALQEVTVDEYVVPDPDGPDEAGKRSCLPVRKVKFKLADKRAALVDLGKHLGMFVERQEHSVSITLEALVMQAVELRMARDAPKVIEHDLPRGS
jgi:phage terminase small subunit